MEFLDILKNINNKKPGIVLVINGQPYGEMQEHVTKLFLEELKSHKDLEYSHTSESISLKVDESKLTALFGSILAAWRERREFGCLLGWRNETYKVFTNSSAFHVERSGIGLFGFRTFGCHLNGYTKSNDGKIKLWIQKRASTKQTYPGIWDNLAAGGLSSGFSARETMIKEAGEEAGVPLDLANQCLEVGIVSFWGQREDEVEPGTVYCYDLLLPANFVPVPEDGEVEEFRLLDIPDLIELLKIPGKFTPEAFLVTVDFLARHGIIDDPKVLTALRAKIPFPIRQE